MIAGYKDSARRILEIYETLASRLMRAEHAAAEPDEDAVRALLQPGRARRPTAFVRGGGAKKAYKQCFLSVNDGNAVF